MEKRARTPLNAPGPFFTEKDFCISCGAPEAEAPDLMAFDDDGGSCYFRRQPQTPEEVDQACRAVEVSCCEAVQYDGNDSEILSRLRRGNPTRYRARSTWWQFWKPT